MKDNLRTFSIPYKKYKWIFWFVAGLLFVFAFLLPYYVLRENAYFMIHDELDDGIFKNILYGRNFGINKSFIPEFMGGQERYTITVSSFWGIFLYKLFRPYTAFLIMYLIVSLTGFCGIYFLGKDPKRDYKGIPGLYRLFRELHLMNFDLIIDMHDVLRTKFLRNLFRVYGYEVRKIDKHRSLRR